METATNPYIKGSNLANAFDQGYLVAFNDMSAVIFQLFGPRKIAMFIERPQHPSSAKAQLERNVNGK